MSENNHTTLLIERVKRAIQSRRKFIVEKKNELGEKSFRRLLETDLRLSKRQLDEPTVKETIGKLLLEVIERGTLEEEDDLEEESEEDEYSEDDDDEDDEAKVLVKRKRKKSEKEPTRERKTETETPNAKVSKLRKLCKDAGITKATHVFMKFKTNLEREDALEKLLGERALDIRATARELAKVKEDIEREKDLEDIDASNIIEGGRRRNTRTQVSYKGLDASVQSIRTTNFFLDLLGSGWLTNRVRATSLLPEAVAFVSYGFVLVQGQVQGSRIEPGALLGARGLS